MKSCPTCRRTYADDTLSFCLQDGTPLIAGGDAQSLHGAGSPLYESGLRTELPPTEILYPEQKATPQSKPTEQQRPRLTEREERHAYVTPKSKSSAARVATISVVATVLLLGLGALGAWLLLRDSGSNDNRNITSENKALPVTLASTPVSSKPTVSPTPRSATPTPTVEVPKSTPVPKAGGWFVVLGSFPKSEMNKANERMRFLQARGYNAYIVDTDEYPNFRGGLWAVVLGPFARKDAQGEANRLRLINPETPYIKPGR